MKKLWNKFLRWWRRLWMPPLERFVDNSENYDPADWYDMLDFEDH